MIKCKVCGTEFDTLADCHYIARDNSVSGLSTLIKDDEVKLYDAFDCPVCGCQNIAQERKRPLIDCSCIEEETEVPEHDGCEGCKYEYLTCEQYPCVDCRGTVRARSEEYYKTKDLWEREDED